MIAPATIEALADAARGLGFALVVRDRSLATPVGIDADGSATSPQYAILRGDEVAFDGTARECSAFLIGWRDLRSSVLGSVRAIDAQVIPEMSGRTRCGSRDSQGRSCLAIAGHKDPLHSALVRWETPWETPP